MNYKVRTTKKQEEIAYIEKFHSGDETLKKEAIEYFVTKHTPFVGSLIKRKYPSFVEGHYHDLLNSGVIGIILALDRFDPEKGRFITFCTNYILHEIIEYVSQNIYQMSSHYANQIKKINRAIDLLELEGNSDPSIADICELTHLRYETVRQAIITKNALNTVYLDEVNEEIANTLAEPSTVCPEEYFEEVEKQDALEKALHSLDDISRYVVKNRFGLNKESQPLNLSEIARHLGVHIEEVRKLLNSAIVRLRNHKELKNTFPDYIGNIDFQMHNFEISLIPFSEGDEMFQTAFVDFENKEEYQEIAF